MKLAYRISTAILGFGSILCAFFLKMFSFTLTLVLFTRNYDYSLFDAIKTLNEKGISISGASDSSSKVAEVLAPMLKPAITFFVLLAIACLFALAIGVLSSATNLHIPQAVLSGTGFILLVIAAGCGSTALGCLTGEEPKVTLAAIVAASTGEVTKENALSTLGSAVSKVQLATISYGFYVLMAIMAGIFIFSIIAFFVCNSEQAKTPASKKHREYKRKKPMRSLKNIGR